ncbi:DUF2235 domain-containing protein [Mucilaginibacter sp. AK015]|uniref:DUF2235 domain-containing protein n=1 Tax=Mucilaginibacter sp. AK015 TaxID=2723072 RepID=UPI001613E84A|nr:DUF2235 domain-containing protein [Mucilaginibacter sp. AK015]MBB5394538.1 uncharacterized protein (DUF2235 family) [Mucilaginibacter sp. AK015]
MKRIIVCSDGTWNKPGDICEGEIVRTNVQKIFEAICNEDENHIKQIKFYDQGVGSSGTKLSRMIDGATGRGLDDNILDAYKFIIWNYEIGDEIFLFGFSRGAYTVRSLAGLIRTAGLVKNNNLRLIQQAYDMYRDRGDKAKHPDGDIAREFREKHSQPEVRIKFIGVWDTVGALGVPVKLFYNRKRYEFHDTTLSSYVDYAYHALAIDERRKNFIPTLWQQSKSVQDNGIKQVFEQRWFTGVHSNIGGGYPDEGLSDIALHWMIAKAKGAGLSFEEGYVDDEVRPNNKGRLYNSNTLPFSILGQFVRKLLSTPRAAESVHPSVFERVDANIGYIPVNLKNDMRNSAAT